MEDRKKPVNEQENKANLSEKDKAKAAARAYAAFLVKQGLKPGEEFKKSEESVKVEEPAKPEESAKVEGSAKAEADDSAEVEVSDKEHKKGKKEKKSKKKKTRSEEENKLSPIARGLASVIDWHDNVQAKCDEFFIEQGRALATEYHRTIATYRASRREMGRSLILMALVCCALLLVFDRLTVYEYAYNGRVLGYVDEQSVVTDVLEVAGEHLSKNNNMDVTFTTTSEDKDEGNITFKEVSSENKDIDDADQVVNKLAYMTDIETTGYGIYEGDKLLTIVKSRSAANIILARVKATRAETDKGMSLLKADFVDTIEIKDVSVMLASIQEENAAEKLLMKGGDTKIYHIMNEGESLDDVAKTFSVSKDDIYDANNEHVVTNYDTGDRVCIHKKVTPVQVEMVEDGTMSEVVKYKTIVKKTKKMYKGDSVVRQKGINGKQVITGKVTKVNGEVTKRDLTKCEVLKKVQNKVVLVGTSKRPKTAPTGIFGVPLSSSSGYIITSRVGARWGSTHEGIDFGCSTGTPIYASDGGTVTIAGWYQGYGLCVQIDHGRGYITRYGHASALYVHVGEKVYKGQKIAAVGSTGHSTGPHLHFEIRKNGAVLDPGPIIGVYG